MPHYDELSSPRAELTLGLTLHKDFADSAHGRECIATKAGVFSLCLHGQAMTWAVNTDGAGWCQVNTTSFGTWQVREAASSSVTLKATYNSSSGLKLFINGKLGASGPCTGGGNLAVNASDLLFGGDSAGLKSVEGSAAGWEHVIVSQLTGAIEEIYLKNASCASFRSFH